MSIHKKLCTGESFFRIDIKDNDLGWFIIA